MKKVYFLLFFCVFTFVSQLAAQNQVRVTPTWRVTKYDISVNLPSDGNDRFMSAKAVLSLKNVSVNPASRVTLRISDKAEVSAAQVNGATATFTRGKDEKLSETKSLQTVGVTLPSVPSGGIISVSVDYKMKVDDNSGLAAISQLSSQFLPLSFWYPTPNSNFASYGPDNAPVKLTVNSGAETVVSSGTQTGSTFDSSLNGQPFLITGSWDKVEGAADQKGISAFLPKGAGPDQRKHADDLMAVTSSARAFIGGLLGAGSDSPIRLIGVRRGAGFSDSGTIFVDRAAFQRQKPDAEMVLSIAESIAKMRLSNGAVINGDGYGVVREGLPRLLATMFLEKQYGKEYADIERQKQGIAYSAVSRRDAPLTIVSAFDDYYYAEVSNKGAMTWRLLMNAVGQERFFGTVKTQMVVGSITLNDLRNAFSDQKALLDYMFDQVTDMNLLAGIPQQAVAGESRAAVRNTGGIDITVNVGALTDKGERLVTQVTIPAHSLGEARFKTVNKIVQVEIDPEKIFPQTDLSDDIAPRPSVDSDPLVTIKRSFDKQDYAAAEKVARNTLSLLPHSSDTRMWLGRSLLAQSRNAEAEREFKAVLDEKLPSARSLAWSNVGLGDIALKANQNSQAAKYFDDAVKIDAEYGATLTARTGRIKSGVNNAIDETIRAFFAQFDKAAISNRKSELDLLIVPGEITRFAGGIAGQAQQWQTKLLFTDRIDANYVLAETSLDIKVLNKEAESGTAVFLLAKSGNSWKIAGVEIFEVR